MRITKGGEHADVSGRKTAAFIRRDMMSVHGNELLTPQEARACAVLKTSNTWQLTMKSSKAQILGPRPSRHRWSVARDVRGVRKQGTQPQQQSPQVQPMPSYQLTKAHESIISCFDFHAAFPRNSASSSCRSVERVPGRYVIHRNSFGGNVVGYCFGRTRKSCTNSVGQEQPVNRLLRHTKQKRWLLPRFAESQTNAH
jgi:hypothetical protein